MKNTSIIMNLSALCLLGSIVSLFSCEKSDKRNYQNCTKDELEMSIHVEPYFDSFIADCKKRSINYDHVYCLKDIHLTHSHSLQGETDFNDCTIAINEHLITDSIGMRFVTYHELGHWFGLDHSDGIMQENYNSTDTESVREHWDELLEDYFTKLKTK